MVIILILLPTFILLMPFWWVIAWVLEQLFPGKDFFPVGKICSKLLAFFNDYFK
ncbi:MAG: hypothetical protein IK145_05195 [Bacteroidales bacterium]|nr:hypothetical protein [Bacteroidales bacterium]